MIRAAFWKRVMLFAFSRWCDASGDVPNGVPFQRDRGDACIAFAPRPATARDWKSCPGDGHELCRTCCHHSPAAEAGAGR